MTIARRKIAALALAVSLGALTSCRRVEPVESGPEEASGEPASLGPRPVKDGSGGPIVVDANDCGPGTDHPCCEFFDPKLRQGSCNSTEPVFIAMQRLACADLRNHDFSCAVMTKANLTGASLDGARLENANARAVILTRASLRAVAAPGAELTRANLTGADLTDALLTGAKLRRAQLACADLTGAILHGADLRAANLRGARGVTVESLRGARLNRTICPDGTMAADCTDHLTPFTPCEVEP